MKKTAFVSIVIVLCLGMVVPAFSQQSASQTTKPKKNPAKQILLEPANPPVPQPAPQAPKPVGQPVVPAPAVQQAPPADDPFPMPDQQPPALAPAPMAQAPALPPVADTPAPSSVAMPAPPVPQQAAPSPQQVELRKQVIKVNYIEAQEAQSILSSYKSPRGRIQVQRNRNVLIIEDTPEFVDKLLSILKELDVKPLDLMFTVSVILGSMEEEGGEPIPGSDRLLKELKSLLKYKHFTRLDTSLVKVQDNGNTSQRMGGEGIGLLLELYPRHVRDGGQDGFQVELRLRQTTRRHERKDAEGKIEYFGSPLEKSMSLLSTSLTLKDGERSVVGVSKLNGGDTALILVIEGKIIK